MSSSTRQQGFAQPLSYDQSRGLGSRREASSRQAACNRGAANLIAGAGPGATNELRRLKASNKSSSIFSASLAASWGTTPAERRARRVGIYEVIGVLVARPDRNRAHCQLADISRSRYYHHRISFHGIHTSRPAKKRRKDGAAIFRGLISTLSADGGRARNAAVVATAHLSRSRR